MRALFFFLAFSVCSLLSSPSASALKFIEVGNPGSGVVDFRILVRAGSIDDPRGKEGLAQFTATLLRRGAGDFDRQTLATKLDDMGAEISLRVEKEFTLIVGRCLTKTLTEFYPLLRAVLTAPRFPEDQVAQAKQDQLDGVNALKNDNIELGIQAFNHLLYAGSRWQHASVGREKTIGSFSREDALNFYRRHYTHKNLVVGIGGDYKSAKVSSLEGRQGSLKKILGKDLRMALLPGSQARRDPADSAPAKWTGRRVLIVEKEGLDQGQINIGHPLTINRSDKDFAPLNIAINHFGSHRNFIGVLMNTVRADRGLTYGAYAYIEYFPYPYRSGAEMLPMLNIARSQQDLRVWTFTLVKNMDFTVRLLLLKLQELVKEGLSAERFKEVQAYVSNKFVFLHESTEQTLAMRLDDTIYGTRKFDKRFIKGLQRASAKRANRAIRRHIDLDNLAIVVLIDDAKRFRKELLKPGATIEYQGAIDPKPLSEEDARAKALDIKILPENVQILDTTALF